MPLRDEFAGMIREVTRKTGRELRAATTMTVTGENLAGVPAVIRWLAANADAFRLVSFQPVAQVGRTQDGLGGAVAVEALWAAIAEGFQGPAAQLETLEGGQVYLGHPACSRYLPGVVIRDQDKEPVFHPLRLEGDPVRSRYFDGFLDRFGGVTFRLDSRRERLVRMAALALRAPAFVLGGIAPYLAHWCRLADPDRPLCFAARLARRRASVTSLVVVSHHFMSRDEIATSLGRERLDLCVFHVPVDGRLAPMCEVNATGVRDRYYATLSETFPERRPNA